MSQFNSTSPVSSALLEIIWNVLFVVSEIIDITVWNRNKFINQIRAPGGNIQITIMIDTQQQYK